MSVIVTNTSPSRDYYIDYSHEGKFLTSSVTSLEHVNSSTILAKITWKTFERLRQKIKFVLEVLLAIKPNAYDYITHLQVKWVKEEHQIFSCNKIRR